MRIRLSRPIDGELIKNAIKPKAHSNLPDVIKYISTDTRDLNEGDLFFALKGENFDGEDFIPDARARGAYTVSEGDRDSTFYVKNTLDALLALAGAYKKTIRPQYTVAITGSVGKTTTKELTADIIAKKYKVHKTDKNLNNAIGVAYTVFSMPSDTEVLIVECGMNHFGELSRISSCIAPDLAVVTKIGSAHIGNLGSREAIAKAKLEILDGMVKKIALIPYGEPLLAGNFIGFSVSCEHKNADFYFIKEKESYTLGSRKTEIANLNPKFISLHVPECLSFALAIASLLGCDGDDVRCAVNSLDPKDYSRTVRIGDITFIDDSYNSSPEAVIMAMRSASAFPNRSMLLGDMLELGEMSAELHYKIGKEAAKHGISKIYAVGKYSSHIASGAKDYGFDEKNIYLYGERRDYRRIAADILSNSHGEAVTVKASRALDLGSVIEIAKELYNII